MAPGRDAACGRPASRRDPALLGCRSRCSGLLRSSSSSRWRALAGARLVDGGRLSLGPPLWPCSADPNQLARACVNSLLLAARGRRGRHRAGLPLRAHRGARAASGAAGSPCSTRRRSCRWSRRPSPPPSRMIFSFGPARLHHPSRPAVSRASPAYGLCQHALRRDADLFPIAYLTMRPDPRGHRSPTWRTWRCRSGLALAGLPQRHPAAGRPGLRQRLPSALRGLAGGLRHAADPCRQ